MSLDRNISGADSRRIPAASGRYAPSPTGPLHLGSLVAALASYLHARSRGGAWYLRMEDIDPAREVPGAADDILRTLDVFGLHWDGPVLYQSGRRDAYEAALDELRRRSLVFPCGCTRREARKGPVAEEGPIYPGTCRNGLPPGRAPRTLRLRVEPGRWGVVDGIQGSFEQELAREVGDFILRRADGWHAYQLAVVVDDAYQGVAEVVRGADLLTSTPRQLLLQSLLDLPSPRYWHVPLLIDAEGQKLSKSTGALALDRRRPAQILVHALDLLGQAPPPALAAAERDDVLTWATANWRPEAVPCTRTLTVVETTRHSGNREAVIRNPGQ